MMRRTFSSLLLSSALLLGAGCASMGRSDPAPEDQIRELQARVLELQRKAAVSDVELARLRQQVADLEARLGDNGAAGVPQRTAAPERMAKSAPVRRQPVGSTPAQRSTVKSAPPQTEMTISAAPAAKPETSLPPALPARPAVRGGSTAGSPGPANQAPAAPARPGAASQRSAEAAKAPETAKAQGTAEVAPAPEITETDIEVPPGGRSSAVPAGAKAAERQPMPAAEPPTPAVQALYDRGYTLYHQKHFIDAEASFQRFLQANPKSALADNAQYWIGECRYSRGDMRGALAAFRETVERYPDGTKAPDALLKAGMSLEALGDREGARASYKDVIRRFPGTAVAAVADERRAKLP